MTTGADRSENKGPAGKTSEGTMTLGEIKEFATFASATQRYIRRSLDIGFERSDAVQIWSRDTIETASIRAQTKVYRRLTDIREQVPEDSGLEHVEPFMAPLVTMTAFDLGQGRLTDFSAYRFLYERLIGAAVRPWLPGAFCAAASLPHLHPDRRRRLLQSITEAAATAPGWSSRQPTFYPQWVEKIDAAVAN